MLYSVHSKPSDYSTVSLNIDIPWKCSYIKYYISSINTMSNILYSTTDDTFEFIDDEKQLIKITFENKYSYEIKELIKKMNSTQMKNDECVNIITFSVNADNTITMLSTKDITIKSISHRIQLLTGLYNTTLPIEIKNNTPYIILDLPVLNYANKLYLVSLQGQPVYSSIGEKEYTPSVIANIDSMILNQAPLIVNYDQTKPIKIKTNSDSLKYLEMRLVDFMYQPIKLMSPLFITIKIKPSTDANVGDIISK